LQISNVSECSICEAAFFLQATWPFMP
jgi:hypothetical protein